jgi:hypothetical protein
MSNHSRSIDRSVDWPPDQTILHLNQTKPNHRTRQYFNHTLAFCAGGALLICAPLAAFSSFGHSYSLCWLTSVPMQFYAFFIPAMLCLLFTVSILFRLARVAHHRYER